MKKIIAKSFILIAAMPFLASCSGSVRDTLGMRREAPNEFRVVSHPPLSVPPEFSLRPPVPEEAYVEPKLAESDARKVLFEKASADITVKNDTVGDDAFRSLFKADKADPQIKSILQKEFIEAAKKEEEKSFIEKNLLSKIPAFSKEGDKKEAPVVNAKLEKERIFENKKLGKKITGSETPIVESNNENSGFLNKILGL